MIVDPWAAEIDRHRADVAYWAYYTFKDKFKPSFQQLRGFELWSTLLRAKMKRKWNQEHPDDEILLSPQEDEIVHKIGLSIQSGHGTGKDGFLAICLLHFHVCFDESRAVVTAPAGPQLNMVIWPELSKWINASEWLKDRLEWNTKRVDTLDHPDRGSHWILPRTINPNAHPDAQAETLAGLHAPYTMRGIDEASGVPDAVMQPFEGGLTDPVAVLLIIYNPTRTTGFAIETQRRDRHRYLNLHWDAEELRQKPPTWVDLTNQYELERKYGRESNFYRIRVRGLPALESPDTLIMWEWIMMAIDREERYLPTDPILFGVDVAGEGTDRSTIAVRRGDAIIALHEKRGLDSNHVSWWVEEVILSYLEEDYNLRYYVGIDVINIGQHVYNYLSRIKQYPGIYGINVAERSSSVHRFHRLRDQAWWWVREAFENGLISIPNNDALIAELNAIRIDDTKTDDKIKILSKNKLRAHLPVGINSPDLADAVMHTEYLKRKFSPSPTMDAVANPNRRGRRRPLYNRPPRSWKTI